MTEWRRHPETWEKLAGGCFLPIKGRKKTGNRSEGCGLSTNMRGAILLMILMGAAVAYGEEIRFSSGTSQVALLELFTSEGCSSCPPAEQWLGERKSDPELWKSYVPIAFHVTYWDYLGWRDSFALPQFTTRQRDYAARWGSGSVYTPCFVRNGREWQRTETPGKPRSAAGELTLRSLASDEWELNFHPVSAQKGAYDGFVALLGRGIESRVRAGENQGKTLAHEFTALTLVQRPLQRDAASGDFSVKVRLASGTTAPRAIAAWVTNSGAPEPLQATGGDLH